jgi:NADH-ubiquinone oxidoreductase chain 4
MESFLILTFTSLDLLMFYVFFETVLIPIFLIIGIWGPRRRRIRASLLLFFYTLFGSILMLFAILVINLQVGSFDYQLLFLCNFSEIKQKFLWLCFFLSFSAVSVIIVVYVAILVVVFLAVVDVAAAVFVAAVAIVVVILAAVVVLISFAVIFVVILVGIFVFVFEIIFKVMIVFAVRVVIGVSVEVKVSDSVDSVVA